MTYSEYVEPLFAKMVQSDYYVEQIFNLFNEFLKDNLPVGKMNFSPADHREFYCSLYE